MSEAEGSELLAVCERVGEAMPDIAGIGILVGFSAQAFISLALALAVFFMTKLGRLELAHEEGSEEFETEKKRLTLVSELLMVGNDIQMLTGAALIITAFASWNDGISLYHLHLIYDTASFVGVSNAAALASWSFVAAKLAASSPKVVSSLRLSLAHKKDFLHAPHHRGTFIFALLFFALTIWLEIRLNSWSLDPNAPLGSCFNTTWVMTPSAQQPRTSKIYVGVTASYLLLVLLWAVFGGPRVMRWVMGLSLLQFPVHLYMMIALRSANQGSLEGEEGENNWDFGQTAAVLLLGYAVKEILSKGEEYYRFERNLKRKEQDSDEEQAVMRDAGR